MTSTHRHANRPGILAGGAGGSRLAALVAAVLAVSALAPPLLDARQARERIMLEAVIASFDTEGRQVYLSPELIPPDGALEAENLAGQIRHSPEHIEVARTELGARILRPHEAIQCVRRSQPETCRLPDNGILFQFMLPRPLQGGRLPIELVVYHDAPADGALMRREAWRFLLTREPGTGWVVLGREHFATVPGPF